MLIAQSSPETRTSSRHFGDLTARPHPFGGDKKKETVEETHGGKA